MSAVLKIEPAEICEATVEDIDRLVSFAEQFWKLTEYADVVEYDIQTMTDTTRDLIETDVVLYAESEGQVVGFLALMISPFPMNRNYLSACEWGFYVDAEHRSSGLGVQLIGRAKQILIEKRVTFFTMIALENLHPKAVGRFYRQQGFKLAECDYMMVLGA